MSSLRAAGGTGQSSRELAGAAWQARFEALVERLAEDLDRLESDVARQRELLESSSGLAVSDAGPRRLSESLEITVEVMREALAELQALRASGPRENDLLLARLADRGG